jgi:hypothetical protein
VTRSDSDALFDAVVNAIPENCTVAVLDWITSNSALVLPIMRLIRECARR